MLEKNKTVDWLYIEDLTDDIQCNEYEQFYTFVGKNPKKAFYFYTAYQLVIRALNIHQRVLYSKVIRHVDENVEEYKEQLMFWADKLNRNPPKEGMSPVYGYQYILENMFYNNPKDEITIALFLGIKFCNKHTDLIIKHYGALMNNYICYCDGAYSSSRDQGGIGIVVLKDDKIILEYSKCYKNTTNNRMEILAIITALRCIKNPIDSFTIYSDSQYCIGCITKDWKIKKNVDLWNKFNIVVNEALKLCPVINYKWVHGHDENIYNNRADELAVKATKLC